MFWIGPKRALEKQAGNCYIRLSGHRFGAQSRGFDPGPGCSNSTAPLFAGSGRRVRTDISSLVWAGVLPIRRAPRDLEPIARPLFPGFSPWEGGLSLFQAPFARLARRGLKLS